MLFKTKTIFAALRKKHTHSTSNLLKCYCNGRVCKKSLAIRSTRKPLKHLSEKSRFQILILVKLIAVVFNHSHKNYNFLDFDWFKKLLFSTNSLAKLLSDNSLLDSLLSDSPINQSHSTL